MNTDTLNMLNQVQSTGITLSDAMALRRISMTLHRWHEMECGTDSGCIERGWRVARNQEKPNDPNFVYDEQGHPYWLDSRTMRRTRIADRETGAIKRLNKIMSRYPNLSAYIQGDPRGAALYILRPGDVPEGADVSAYYSRGIAVYK